MFLRSKFLPASEHAKLRFVQHNATTKKSPWILVGSEPDHVLAARADGEPMLVSPEIDITPLRELGADDELRRLIEGSFSTKTEERNRSRIRELLALCPRSNYHPMIDLDVADGYTRADALVVARVLDPAFRELGVRVRWCDSGSRAGVHGDILAPEGYAHADLLEQVRFLVVEIAKKKGVSLLSYFREKATRPPVVLDDTVFRRNPDGRGSLWHPLGARKPNTGRPKRAIDLDGNPVESFEPGRWPLAELERARAIVDRQRELDGARFGRSSARPRRPIVPVVLPPSTSHLKNFADALGRYLVAGARHEARLACAGWLLRLGIAPWVVEATLSRASGDAEDTADAVASTKQRIDAHAPCHGLPKLQQLLGGAACVELRTALERDGVSAAVKKHWTDHERRLLMRCSKGLPFAHPGRKALRDGARCGTFSLPYECPDHGPQGARTNAEERELTCPHCRESRIAARLEILRETLKAQSYGVLVVPVDLANPDRLRALVLARRAAKAVSPLVDRRWNFGNDHVLLVFDEKDARFLRSRASQLLKKEKPERGEEKHWQALRDWKLRVEDFRTVSRAELLEICASTWRQPGVALQGLVEVGDEAGVLAFPWLQRSNVTRTAANKRGRAIFPWPSNKQIRERAKARASAARGGIDPAVCISEKGVDELGQPIPCMQPYHVHVDHLPTGTRLRQEPYVGRFPQRQELHLLLEIADPEVLRAGYEQQRALARRR